MTLASCPLTTKALCVGIVLIAAVFSRIVRTQSEQDPHLPQRQSYPGPNEVIQVDDMLLTPERYAELTAPAPEVSRRQGNVYGLGVRFGSWDWGVIPYELAPDFTESESRNLATTMRGWESVAPIVFVPRTTQSGFLAITRDAPLAGSTIGSPCFSDVGQGRGLGQMHRANLGGQCGNSVSTVYHELGHALGLHHEHQRADRDSYVTVVFDPAIPSSNTNYRKHNFPLVGPYDLLSIMHYAPSAAITLLPEYQSFANQVGRAPAPSATDQNVVALIYNAQLRDSAIRVPTEAARSRFDRADMLLAMERLHSFYMSRMGLQRPQGLSIQGRPDFLGIAQWIFDIYLPARSGGFSQVGAFDIVAAAITRTDEWRQKNPGRTPLTPSGYRAAVSLNRDEFLDVLNRLDRFYSAPEGLQRPNGLSISGGPDFLGIATWIFDIYLTERLNGISPNGAWTITENAIRNTGEWRSKH